MSKINGYIEVNGVINKVTSVEDLKRIAEGLGKEFKEMTKDELERLCKIPGHRDYVDDCGIVYNENNVLWRANEKSYALDQYKVLNGTVAISSNAFNSGNCVRDVNHIFIPSSVIAIGESSFKNNGLEEVLLPPSIQYIGRRAFMGCKWLKFNNLILPKDLKYLEAKAFQGCGYIKHVVFNDNIKIIGSNAFKRCNFLESVYIPSTVEVIGSGIFDECPYFKTIYIPTGSMEKFKEFFPFDIDKLVEVNEIPDFNERVENQE